MKELYTFRKYLAEENTTQTTNDTEYKLDYGQVGEVEYDEEHDEFDTSNMEEEYYPPSNSFE